MLAPGGIPPTVQITCPVPSPIVAHVTPPAIRIVWDGHDPDGHPTTEPVGFKHLLLGPGSEFPVSLALADPDSLREYYANHPSGPWAGWDSTGTDSTSARFTNLIPNEHYVFAVIAFDRTGLYSPVFSLSTNMLHFLVSYADYPGLTLTVNGPGFQREYTGFNPSDEGHVQVPAGHSVTFHWSADPAGSCEAVLPRDYRWTLDIADLFDETPRFDEETDLAHWSQRSPTATSATLPPFQLTSPPASEDHLFSIQVRDDVGVVTLGTVRITVVPSTNRPPDCSGATATIAGGGADGSFAAVSIGGVTDPDGDPVTITVTGVTQDEPVDDAGDGSTCPDATIVDGAAQVRRERAGSGNGRVYSIHFTATDGSGGSCSGVADVCVPHDRGRGRSCVKDSVSVNSLGGCGDAIRRGARGQAAN